MSALLKRLTQQLIDKGQDAISSAKSAKKYLIKQGNIAPNGLPTMQGRIRGEMTAGERAIDRQKKYRGDGDYTYNPDTNKATKK